VIGETARRTILEYIDTGKREGRLVAGGEAPSVGYFIRPTNYCGCRTGRPNLSEEIFGPVLAVTKARDFEHALGLANDSQYGLTGAVFSNNADHLREAKERFTSATCISTGSAPGDGGRPPLRRLQHVGHGFQGRRAGLFYCVSAGEIGGGEVGRRFLQRCFTTRPGTIWK